jgi:hypothetical protein
MATKSKRRVAEGEWVALLDAFDKSGYNSGVYKQLFKGMTDAQFTKFMTAIVNGEENVSFEIDSMNDAEQRLDHLFATCKKLGIPTHQHVIYPSNTSGDATNTPVSPIPALIINIPVKRLQQMLSKKNTAAGDNDVVNPLLGQVTSSSKGASLSDTQVTGLVTTGQFNTIKELMGPRSDDLHSKMQMLSKIKETGGVRMSDMNIDPQNKQSTKTMEVFLKSVGLSVRTK